MKLTQEHARAIAKKLKADIEPKRKHDQVIVRYDGSIVAYYGIRRSSRAVGHDYIPEQLHVSSRQAKDLAQCSLDRDSYFTLLRDQGMLPESDTQPRHR